MATEAKFYLFYRAASWRTPRDRQCALTLPRLSSVKAGDDDFHLRPGYLLSLDRQRRLRQFPIPPRVGVVSHIDPFLERQRRRRLLSSLPRIYALSIGRAGL